MKTGENGFQTSEFLSPPEGFTPVYSWIWNGKLTKERIDGQMAEMIRLGVKAFYIIPEPLCFRPATMPSMMSTEYLSPEYFEYYRYTLEKAREAGLRCWLYDEGGWPSGGACGKVLYEHPELAKRTLRAVSKTFHAGEVYKNDAPETSAAFINKTEMLSDGHVFSEDTEVRIYESYIAAWETAGQPDYPDLTLKESTEAFLKSTHELYKDCIGEFFGSTVGAVFTDEPHAPKIPFREELIRAYEEKYGESVLPYLPVLYGDVTVTDETFRVRRRWFDMCSKLFCENYLGECRKWANANGLRFTGHVGGDDHPLGCIFGAFFHVLRCLRQFDVPGVDVIWRQIFPGEKKTFKLGNGGSSTQAENRFFPRYASSAAAQTGGSEAMTESFGIYGPGLTFGIMRYVLGFQAVRGVTVMNLMAFTSAREGYTMAQSAPSFSEIQGCHRDIPTFNRYLERLSYAFTRGERVCDTALYYPVNDFWGWDWVHAASVAAEYDGLGAAIERRGIDFDIADDDLILQSPDLKKGVLSMGNAKYNKLAIPKSAYISPEVKAALDGFVKGGGKVVYDAAGLTPDVNIRGGDGYIRVMRRTVGGRDYICLYNESEKKETFAVDVGGRGGYLLDITFGAVHKLAVAGGFAEITLESGESAILYLTDEALDVRELPTLKNRAVLEGPYTFRRLDRFVIGERFPEYEKIDEAPAPMALGEWSGATGRDFTGSGLYETRFNFDGGPAVLDLGDVRYTCEVFLNGKSLGVRVMKPYRYEIPADALKKENLLQIRVSNTPANQHRFTKSFDKYRPWQLSIYKPAQDVFDSDSLDSGLYGPVTLLY